VDGNDVVAVYKTMQKAVEQARDGKPVLIEAMTFRQGPHTTADDETKYRTTDEEEKWLAKDPIKRMKKYLIKQKLWNEELDQKEYELADDLVTEAFEKAINTPKTEMVDVFESVYEQSTVQVTEQRTFFMKGK